MIKPPKGGRMRRRAVTVSVYGVSWLLLTVLSPVWILLGLVVGIVRRRAFILLRLCAFGWFYFGFELMALVLIAATFVVRRNPKRRLEALYRLQAWWASVNLRAAQTLLHLSIVVDGAASALPGPSILLVRHASILDTLVACAYVQRPYRYPIRYILKQELLFDPCIDIVGNALPNYFVDRGGSTAEELAGIRALVTDLGGDGVLLFPEGTRFSRKKQQMALARLQAEGGSGLDAAQTLTHVLPPKPGGVLTLLDALPDVDCVFVAHAGLEAFAKVRDLLSGAVVGSTVLVQFWRVAANQIPNDDDERMRWLFQQWGKVNEFVRNATETS
ncbi:MAG: lysophospholipid acyltransferase family protein [Myxococcales bacterium]|nr:MAG: lysophospholipid acyltransferase family protein [Myxococcales bacterium]